MDGAISSPLVTALHYLTPPSLFFCAKHQHYRTAPAPPPPLPSGSRGDEWLRNPRAVLILLISIQHPSPPARPQCQPATQPVSQSPCSGRLSYVKIPDFLLADLQ